MPDVTGDSEDNARSALEGAGLRVGKVTREESGEEPGTVIEQSPAAGEEVDKGDAVDLTVAQADRDPRRGRHDRGRGADGARGRRLRGPVRDQTVTDPAEDGIVLSQSPAAEEERRQGSRVTIVVGRIAEATPTPSPTTVP